MEINNLLDDCKRKLGVESDYKLAQLTGISDARISDYRGGKRVPDVYACMKIAETLGMDALKLITHFEAVSAKSEGNKRFFEKKLAELGGLAASIFLVVTFIVTPYPAEASNGAGCSYTSLYIM